MKEKKFDLIIIGAGANGIGTALAAIEKGLKPLVLDAHDFSEGTSSKSTKLIHGGIRYLAQGHYRLVKEALHARSEILQEAPDLVQKLEFTIPTTSVWEKAYYFFGLKVYQWLSGKHSLGTTRTLNQAELLKKLPHLNANKFKHGVSYYDAQFDDALLIALSTKFIQDHGGEVKNRHKVVDILKDDNGKVNGVTAVNNSGTEYTFYSSVVINATGVFTDQIQDLADDRQEKTVQPSRGTHIVIPAKDLVLKTAFVVPETNDGRIIFGVPWQDHVILGTTDLNNPKLEIEPVPLPEEIDFILDNVRPFFKKKIKKEQITSCWTGLRPLYYPGTKQNTKKVNRSHKILTSASGLISVIGGKWTTFRKIGRDVLHHTPYDRTPNQTKFELRTVCKNKKAEIDQIIKQNPDLKTTIHSENQTPLADVVWHIRHTQCLTPLDYLSRRNRLVFLNANHAIEAYKEISNVFESELNWSISKKNNDKKTFLNYVQHYRIQSIIV